MIASVKREYCRKVSTAEVERWRGGEVERWSTVKLDLQYCRSRIFTEAGRRDSRAERGRETERK